MSKKTWIILVIIIVCIILVDIIVRTLMLEYIEREGYKELKKALINIPNTESLEYQYTKNKSNYVYIEDISELKKIMQNYEAYVQNQTNELKTKGETEFLMPEVIYSCKDGTSEYYIPNRYSMPCGGDENLTKTEYGEFKNFTMNDSKAVGRVIVNSEVITIGEYNVYNLENLESSKKTTSDIISITLDLLSYFNKKGALWGVQKNIMPAGEKTNLIDRDIKGAITVIENFDRSYEIPTEQEINNVYLKEKCIVSFKETMKGEGNTYSQALKTPFWQKILFINYNIKKICEDLERIEKQNAIKMLKDNENEQNPFMSIERKTYLNLFVKCSEDAFPRECKAEYSQFFGTTYECIKAVCTGNYTEEINNKIDVALNAAEIEGFCREDRACGYNEICENNTCITTNQ